MFTMYIALRWLIGLSLAMWVAVCCTDLYIESSKGNQYKGFALNLFKSKNITNTIKQGIESNGRKPFTSKQQDTAMLHYAMFFAGALAVSVFNKKKEIVLYTRRKFICINVCTERFLRNNIKFKRTAYIISVAMVKSIGKLWAYCKRIINSYLFKRKLLLSYQRINLELLKKIREYTEERKNLGQLLISAIRENKTIRTRHQIETTAKNRLLQYIEDTQKQIKEHRSKYISFQHLYLVTHQENIFLKARLKKVCKEKEEAEKNLFGLVNEVYQSKNNELKAYCSHFIVGTRENLLNSDVHAEIRKFLYNSAETSCSFQNMHDNFDLETDTRITEIIPDDETLVPLISEAPKLKGLPGECIWTVKDKDAIIEKLYEYDYETDFDNGDIIRRISKYSVYHDKDCLLDITSSKTALYDISTTTISLQQQQYLKVEYPRTSQRFLTGSQAFQNFLQDNQNLVHLPLSRPALLCE